MPDNGASPSQRKRVAASGVVGNVLEWYDFSLYGYLAPITAPLFFPSDDPLTSLVQSFAVFAIGFVARPIGGVIYGHIGDRMGRRHLLMLSVVAMAVPTVLMGLLPTYEAIGIAAPILLVVLRLVQGLSAGGEFSGSIIFLVEHAPPGRRGFMGSLSNFGAMIGGLLGLFVGWLVTEWLDAETMSDWGWRIPFLAGVLVSLFGLWVRKGMPDSPAYVSLQKAGQILRNPIVNAFRHQSRPMLITVGLNWIVSAGYYVVFVWLITDLTKVAGLDMHDAMGIGVLGLAFGMALTPVMGHLSDRIGQRAMLVIASLLTAVAVVPLLLLADIGTYGSGLAAQLGLAFLMAMLLGTMPAVFVSLFTADARCSSMSIGYNAALALFGGTSPLIATYLVDVTGWSGAPGLYLAVTALVCLALVPFVPRSMTD
ncbi:MAG: MFS transporter [Pseudomonadota bacterium]